MPLVENVIKIDPGTARGDAGTTRETKNQRILIENVIKIDPGTMLGRARRRKMKGF